MANMQEERLQERQGGGDELQLQMEADRMKLGADISAKLQQQNAQFCLDMMQQNQQEFQVGLLKRLFDKDSQISYCITCIILLTMVYTLHFCTHLYTDHTFCCQVYYI